MSSGYDTEGTDYADKAYGDAGGYGTDESVADEPEPEQKTAEAEQEEEPPVIPDDKEEPQGPVTQFVEDSMWLLDAVLLLAQHHFNFEAPTDNPEIPFETFLAEAGINPRILHETKGVYAVFNTTKLARTKWKAFIVTVRDLFMQNKDQIDLEHIDGFVGARMTKVKKLFLTAPKPWQDDWHKSLVPKPPQRRKKKPPRRRKKPPPAQLSVSFPAPAAPEPIFKDKLDHKRKVEFVLYDVFDDWEDVQTKMGTTAYTWTSKSLTEYFKVRGLDVNFNTDPEFKNVVTRFNKHKTEINYGRLRKYVQLHTEHMARVNDDPEFVKNYWKLLGDGIWDESHFEDLWKTAVIEGRISEDQLTGMKVRMQQDITAEKERRKAGAKKQEEKLQEPTVDKPAPVGYEPRLRAGKPEDDPHFARFMNAHKQFFGTDLVHEISRIDMNYARQRFYEMWVDYYFTVVSEAGPARIKAENINKRWNTNYFKKEFLPYLTAKYAPDIGDAYANWKNKLSKNQTRERKRTKRQRPPAKGTLELERRLRGQTNKAAWDLAVDTYRFDLLGVGGYPAMKKGPGGWVLDTTRRREPLTLDTVVKQWEQDNKLGLVYQRQKKRRHDPVPHKRPEQEQRSERRTRFAKPGPPTFKQVTDTKASRQTLKQLQAMSLETPAGVEGFSGQTMEQYLALLRDKDFMKSKSKTWRQNRVSELELSYEKLYKLLDEKQTQGVRTFQWFSTWYNAARPSKEIPDTLSRLMNFMHWTMIEARFMFADAEPETWNQYQVMRKEARYARELDKYRDLYPKPDVIDLTGTLTVMLGPKPPTRPLDEARRKPLPDSPIGTPEPSPRKRKRLSDADKEKIYHQIITRDQIPPEKFVAAAVKRGISEGDARAALKRDMGPKEFAKLMKKRPPTKKENFMESAMAAGISYNQALAQWNNLVAEEARKAKKPLPKAMQRLRPKKPAPVTPPHKRMVKSLSRMRDEEKAVKPSQDTPRKTTTKALQKQHTTQSQYIPTAFLGDRRGYFKARVQKEVDIGKRSKEEQADYLKRFSNVHEHLGQIDDDLEVAMKNGYQFPDHEAGFMHLLGRSPPETLAKFHANPSQTEPELFRKKIEYAQRLHRAGLFPLQYGTFEAHEHGYFPPGNFQTNTPKAFLALKTGLSKMYYGADKNTPEIPIWANDAQLREHLKAGIQYRNYLKGHYEKKHQQAPSEKLEHAIAEVNTDLGVFRKMLVHIPKMAAAQLEDQMRAAEEKTAEKEPMELTPPPSPYTLSPQPSSTTTTPRDKFMIGLRNFMIDMRPTHGTPLPHFNAPSIYLSPTKSQASRAAVRARPI